MFQEQKAPLLIQRGLFDAGFQRGNG